MKVIYHCYGGSHSSVLAANIHVGNLDPSRLPTARELFRLPYFDRTTDQDFGRIKLVGSDLEGNQIYCLGQMDLGSRLQRVLEGLLELTDTREQVLVVGTMRYVNLTMMLGGNLSRKRSLPAIGRPLIVWGSRRAFSRLVSLVEQVKCNIRDRGLVN